MGSHRKSEASTLKCAESATHQKPELNEVGENNSVKSPSRLVIAHETGEAHRTGFAASQRQSKTSGQNPQVGVREAELRRLRKWEDFALEWAESA